jgi:hypothetical protein
MSKVIKCKLDVASLDRAISELDTYQEELISKLESFVDALLSVGVAEASGRASSYAGDSKPARVVAEYVLKSKDSILATIALVGEDALFIEFGAGIAYNTGMEHPKAGEFGYGVGTYPSKHPPNRAINPGYWFYRENGELKKSIGTQATMPIYFASETMRNNAIQKALEIFRS